MEDSVSMEPATAPIHTLDMAASRKYVRLHITNMIIVGIVLLMY